MREARKRLITRIIKAEKAGTQTGVKTLTKEQLHSLISAEHYYYSSGMTRKNRSEGLTITFNLSEDLESAGKQEASDWIYDTYVLTQLGNKHYQPPAEAYTAVYSNVSTFSRGYQQKDTTASTAAPDGFKPPDGFAP